MGIFDDILKAAPAEDRAIFDKYPALKQSTEKLEADLGQVSRYAGEWVNWQKQNWDASAGMTVAEKALRDELAAAQTRIAAGVGTSVDDDTVKALEAKFDSKVSDVQKQSMAAIEGMNVFYGTAAKRMLPHQREFGEDLDPQSLMKFMAENKINDPDLAYDRMVAGRRAENATKHATELDEKHKLEIQEAEKRGREAAAREVAMGPNGVLPTDHTGGIAGITARVDRPAPISDETKARVSDAKLGDGSLAALGYQAFLRGELSVQ